MNTETPFFIDDIDGLRQSLLSGGCSGWRGKLWDSVLKSARSSHYGFAWYTPFVALVTRETRDIENAKSVLQAYVDKLGVMNYCTGLQFHFWCFAFPHAKWCIYFQWLRTVGAYTPEEAAEMEGVLLEYQFTHFYYGLRTKPEPECADNQVMSLSLSNLITGYLFGGAEKPGLARLLMNEGLRRLPAVIGGIPRCGYSGEGTPYMDVVVGPALWMSLEMLRLMNGRDMLYEEFPPSMVRPVDIFDVIARQWMPGSLLLPWDNYGYQMGVRQALAYIAKRTGRAIYYDRLEKDSVLSYDIGTGWAYDDLVWTLIHYSGTRADEGFSPYWFNREVGGILEAGDHYAMQMWDESTPGYPTRAHANPNAVIFNAYGTPLSADGSKTDTCERFYFDNTWKTVSYMKMNAETRFNYGDGCAGAHSCLLVDHDESLMANSTNQVNFDNCSLESDTVTGDVTPFYAENYEGIQKVVRKTTLCCGRFFLVEDFVESLMPYRFTSRFVVRTGIADCKHGVKVMTGQRVSLNLIALDESDVSTEIVIGYPRKPDNACVLVDFTSPEKTAVCRRIVAFASRDVIPGEPLTAFLGFYDDMGLDYPEAAHRFNEEHQRFDLLLPPYMEREVPVKRTWWFKRRVKPDTEDSHIILPMGFINARLFINGREIDLTAHIESALLTFTYIEIPAFARNGEGFDIVFKTDVPVSHYEGGGDGRVGLCGGIRLGKAVREETVDAISEQDGILRVTTNIAVYEHRMEA